MEQDLTVGSVPKRLFRFSLPLLGANLLQSLYNLVDMAVVGRFVGSDALAAVSSAVLLCYIISAICSGVTMGGGVLAAQYKGAGDATGLRESVRTLFLVSAVCSLLVTVVGLLIYRPVFALMNVPADALPHAYAYMPVICLGTVFVFGYFAACAVLRGLGDSKSPLIFVAVTAVVNVVLDLVLVGALDMGAAGAAWATVFSQGCSCLVSVLALKRRFPRSRLARLAAGSISTPSAKNAASGCARRLFFRLRGSLSPLLGGAALLLKVGLPTAVQMGVLNLSYLLVTGMLNSYGVVVAAAAGVGLKINTFAAMPCWAVGTAVTTMAGQCAGAGDRDRAASVCKAGVKLAMGLSLVMAVLVWVFAAPLVGLFDADPAVIAEGARYLHICCSLNCVVYAAMYVWDSFATGVGWASLAMANSLLQSVVFRLLFSWLLGRVLGLGYVGIFWAECLSPLLPAVVAGAFFHSGAWRKRSLI